MTQNKTNAIMTLRMMLNKMSSKIFVCITPQFNELIGMPKKRPNLDPVNSLNSAIIPDNSNQSSWNPSCHERGSQGEDIFLKVLNYFSKNLNKASHLH